MSKSLLLCACFALALAGCESPGEPGRQDIGLTHPAFRQPVENPGELHNRIARAYAAKRSGEPIRRDEFVTNAAEAVNQVLREEGLPPFVRPADINRAIGEFVRLRNDGVFDIFAESPDEPVVIVDAWERSGFLDQATASALRARLSRTTGEPIPLLDSEEPSEILIGFDSVRRASMDYWTREEAIHVGRRIASGLDPQKRRDYIYQMDAIGFVAGALLAGGTLGGTIVGFAASWAFMEVPPADDDIGWQCSDYCDMG